MFRRSRLAVTAALGLSLALEASAVATPATGFLSRVTWHSADPAMGGVSAIEVTAGGDGFVALSDRGTWTQGRLIRDAAGRLTGVQAAPFHPLLGPDGTALKKRRTDSEGLAQAASGQWFVSFEGVTRVMRFARMDGPGENLPTSPAFKSMEGNGGLEALAAAPDGTLFTLPEVLRRDDRQVPVYRLAQGTWRVLPGVSRDDTYRVVGADIGPDGRLYLLDRAFFGLGGFAARVRRFTLTDAGLTDEQVVMQSRAGQFDNLEGLSVWRDGLGRLRMTLVSDDNFRLLQRTEIVDYALPG